MSKIPSITPELAEVYSHDIIRFLEDQYVVTPSKRLIVLEEWQKDMILRPLFYDLRPDGGRKYNLALVGMPKKNGKSTLAAGIGLWFTIAGDEFGEIIIAANDLDQASLVIYTKIKQAIQLNPQLSSSAKIYKDRIEVRSTGTTCRPIAHQYQTAAGANPTLVLFDELWGFPSREFYDELTTSPARKDPLNLVVTYAGYDTDSLLYELYDKGVKHEDPDMFFIWLNDNLASWVTEDYLVKQQRRMPQNVYMRFHENKWAPAGTSFVTQDDIAMIHSVPWRMQLSASAERSFYYVVACDLGLSDDRTARAVAHYDPVDQRVYIDNLKVWEGTKTEHVSIADVETDLMQTANLFKTKTLVIDPWQMEATIQKLKGQFNVVPFNFHTDVTPMSQSLIQLIRSCSLAMYNEPLLDDELRKLVARQTPRGWRIDHVRGQKDDCVMAVGMAAFEVSKLAWASTQIPEAVLSARRPMAFNNIRARNF